MSKLVIDLNASAAILLSARNLIDCLLDEGGITPAIAKTVDISDEVVPVNAEVLHQDEPATMANAPDTSGNAEAPSASQDVAGASDVSVDENGVAFSATMCAKAAKPFYASGKYKGQWKRRGGVDQAVYDVWYEAELDSVPALDAAASGTELDHADTSAAFGKTETALPLNDIPKDGGEFMVWTSEQTASGALDQAQVGQAYADAGYQIMDIFPSDSNTPAACTAIIAEIYDILIGQV